MLLGVDDSAIRQRESGGRPILFMRPSARRALQPVSYVLNVKVRGPLFLERVHFVLIYGDVSLFFLYFESCVAVIVTGNVPLNLIERI